MVLSNVGGLRQDAQNANSITGEAWAGSPSTDGTQQNTLCTFMSILACLRRYFIERIDKVVEEVHYQSYNGLQWPPTNGCVVVRVTRVGLPTSIELFVLVLRFLPIGNC